MKLIIKRNQEQKKGLFGGNKGIEFILECKAELTKEELELVNKAKVGDYFLTTYPLLEDEKGIEERDLCVNDLLDGITSKAMNVQKLLIAENKIKEGAKNLKLLLNIIKSFGGEEIIEI